MKNVFLALAIIGALVPYYFFLQHFGLNGYGLADFVAGIFATPAASGFTADLLITSLAFWIYMFGARRGSTSAPSPWPFVALNLLIGLSCALPAYLYVRLSAAATVPA